MAAVMSRSTKNTCYNVFIKWMTRTIYVPGYLRKQKEDDVNPLLDFIEKSRSRLAALFKTVARDLAESVQVRIFAVLSVRRRYGITIRSVSVGKDIVCVPNLRRAGPDPAGSSKSVRSSECFVSAPPPSVRTQSE